MTNSSSHQNIATQAVVSSTTLSTIKEWGAILPIIWQIILAFGGFVFLLFYVSIGFMPELDLTAIISLLSAASLIGVFFVLALAAYFVFPGWVLKGVVESDKFFKSMILPRDKISIGRLLIFYTVPICLAITVLNLAFWWLAELTRGLAQFNLERTHSWMLASLVVLIVWYLICALLVFFWGWQEKSHGAEYGLLSNTLVEF